MTSLTFSPKSFLIKIADMFQGRETMAETEESNVRTLPTEQENMPLMQAQSKSRLSISMDELKVISTALLQYRRNLAKVGEMDRANNVGQIDKKIYELIQGIEHRSQEEELSQAAA